MKTERLLSYTLAKKLTEAEIQHIAAAGGTNQGTFEATHTSQGGSDVSADCVLDM